jgi:Protein of unknown function (DUF4058)
MEEKVETPRSRIVPSPFPGMDPYLENPDWFPNLHDALITFIVGALMRCLPEPYYARSRQRVWLEYAHRQIEPDADVLHSGLGTSRLHGGQGGLAIADEVDVAEPVVVSVESIEQDPVQEPFVEIHRRDGSDDRLVASIEVVSPANKTPGNPGRQQYLAKQAEVLAGQAHLVEIDLLRGGTHVTAVPRGPAVEKAGTFEYHVCVHRFHQPNDYFVYPVRLEERLPGIAIPLLPGDPDVPLSLQAVFDRAYDEGPYHRTVRYGEAPIIPPLPSEQFEWVRRLTVARR